MAQGGSDVVARSVRLIDSGCSIHMTGERSLFHELDETKMHTVKLGDDKRTSSH